LPSRHYVRQLAGWGEDEPDRIQTRHIETDIRPDRPPGEGRPPQGLRDPQSPALRSRDARDPVSEDAVALGPVGPGRGDVLRRPGRSRRVSHVALFVRDRHMGDGAEAWGASKHGIDERSPRGLHLAYIRSVPRLAGGELLGRPAREVCTGLPTSIVALNRMDDQHRRVSRYGEGCSERPLVSSLPYADIAHVRIQIGACHLSESERRSRNCGEVTIPSIARHGRESGAICLGRRPTGVLEELAPPTLVRCASNNERHTHDIGDWYEGGHRYA
jgi:hypothetical protein